MSRIKSKQTPILIYHFINLIAPTNICCLSSQNQTESKTLEAFRRIISILVYSIASYGPHTFEFRVLNVHINLIWMWFASFSSKIETSKKHDFNSSCRLFNLKFELDLILVHTLAHRQPFHGFVITMFFLFVSSFYFLDFNFVNNVALVFVKRWKKNSVKCHGYVYPVTWKQIKKHRND